MAKVVRGEHSPSTRAAGLRSCCPPERKDFSVIPSPSIEPTRLLSTPTAVYDVRLARDVEDVRRAQALRFQVFNVELGEGLAASVATRLDEDPFDAVCDHLVVEHAPTRTIVGTYRLQTGRVALSNLGYYGAQEFDFGPYEAMRGELLELGRACVHQQHRNLIVLGLLWRGIAGYARSHGVRFLCGCSSLTSQDPAVGASAYADLCRQHLVAPAFRTRPWPGFECPLGQLAEESPAVPKLLRAYLSLGAKVCGPPAIDREFRTIDFLTLLDLETVADSVRDRFLR